MKNKKKFKDLIKEYTNEYKEFNKVCDEYCCNANIKKEIYFIFNSDSLIYYDLEYYYSNIIYNEIINDKEVIVGRSICDSCLIKFRSNLDSYKLINGDTYKVVPEDKVYLYKIL